MCMDTGEVKLAMAIDIKPFCSKWEASNDLISAGVKEADYTPFQWTDLDEILRVEFFLKYQRPLENKFSSILIIWWVISIKLKFAKQSLVFD